MSVYHIYFLIKNSNGQNQHFLILRNSSDLPNILTQAENVQLELFVLKKIIERLPQLKFDPRSIQLSPVRQIDEIGYVTACLEYENEDIIDKLPDHESAGLDKVLEIVCKYPFAVDGDLENIIK